MPLGFPRFLRSAARFLRADMPAGLFQTNVDYSRIEARKVGTRSVDYVRRPSWLDLFHSKHRPSLPSSLVTIIHSNHSSSFNAAYLRGTKLLYAVLIPVATSSNGNEKLIRVRRGTGTFQRADICTMVTGDDKLPIHLRINRESSHDRITIRIQEWRNQRG